MVFRLGQSLGTNRGSRKVFKIDIQQRFLSAFSVLCSKFQGTDNLGAFKKEQNMLRVLWRSTILMFLMNTIDGDSPITAEKTPIPCHLFGAYLVIPTPRTNAQRLLIRCLCLEKWRMHLFDQ